MGLLFDIKRYAINDGPGIRITLFLKGCPMSCVWCHNPEGIGKKPVKLYTRKKCIGCQTCVHACPEGALQLTRSGIVTDATKCKMCGTCVEVCPACALEISGREWTVNEAMREIEKETAVMDRSEGGVTFCGGEPLMQPDFLLELLTRCGQEDIHRAVDTTLYASEEVVRQVIPLCDLFLVDLKLMDSEKHRHYCGVPNERVLENLRLVAASDVPYWIRIPLIDGVNADEENIRKSAEFLAGLPKPPEMINLLVYHDIGKNKHDKLGTTYNPHQYAMRAPDEATQQRCLDIFAEHQLTAKIGG